MALKIKLLTFQLVSTYRLLGFSSSGPAAFEIYSMVVFQHLCMIWLYRVI